MMRQNINLELGKVHDINNIYQKIEEIATKEGLADEIGNYLVSAILKTELQGAKSKLKASLLKERSGFEVAPHFGFALVTAYGAVKTTGSKEKKVTKITASGSIANVKTNPTMQQAVSNLKNGSWKLSISDKPTTDDVKQQKRNTEESTTAKIFFNVGVGEVTEYQNLLQLNIRYKGDFTASPQFQGGLSPTLEKILKNKDKQLEYKFTKACKK